MSAHVKQEALQSTGSSLWTRYDAVSVPEVLRRRQATKKLASQTKKNYKFRDMSWSRIQFLIEKPFQEALLP